jgi:drug/metabolite transporter (DMT)-like permease
MSYEELFSGNRYLAGATVLVVCAMVFGIGVLLAKKRPQSKATPFLLLLGLAGLPVVVMTIGLGAPSHALGWILWVVVAVVLIVGVILTIGRIAIARYQRQRKNS